jgi:hypothetical protein
MFDYSVFDKQTSVSYKNPKPKNNPNIRLEIVLPKRSFHIVLDKDTSLEDLYLKMYNTIYPEFSTEKMVDMIPPENISVNMVKVPQIHHVSVFDNAENIIPIPIHKFISISQFIKVKPECFKNTAYIGMPTYKIYAIDEDSMNDMRRGKALPRRSSIRKLFPCF